MNIMTCMISLLMNMEWRQCKAIMIAIMTIQFMGSE